MISHQGQLSTPFTRILHILKRRRRGKIAHLPEPVREQINLMLLDGHAYADIIARLGDAARGLNKDNLSRWRKADYQDWLDEHRWREAVGQQPQFAGGESTYQISRLLMEFDDSNLSQTLSRDPGKLPRLLNVVARISEASCEFYRQKIK